MKSERIPVTQDQLVEINRVLSLLVGLLVELNLGCGALRKAVAEVRSRPSTEKAVIEAINDLSNRMDRFQRSVKHVAAPDYTKLFQVPWTTEEEAKPKAKRKPRRRS